MRMEEPSCAFLSEHGWTLIITPTDFDTFTIISALNLHSAFLSISILYVQLHSILIRVILFALFLLV